jgi:hypothetical protein
MVELPQPVMRLIDAANNGDRPGLLASFDTDGVVDDWGREFHGAGPIGEWSDAEFIGRQVSLDVQAVADDDGEVVVTAQVGGNGFVGPSHFSFRIVGDRIGRMTIRA